MPNNAALLDAVLDIAEYAPESLDAVLGAVGDPAKADALGESVAPQAVGVMLKEPGGKILFLRRTSRSTDHAGEWNLPGGMIEDGETPQEALARELREETGYAQPINPQQIHSQLTDGAVSKVNYDTYAATVPDAFTPTLNSEHTEYRWATADDAPEPLHPGVRECLDYIQPDDDRTVFSAPGAPPRPGLVWREETKRWIRPDGAPHIETGYDLHHAKRQQQELASYPTHLQEANSPINTPAMRQHHADVAERMKKEHAAITDSIAEAEARGLVPDTGYVLPQKETSLHDLAGGKKLHLFNVDHAGQKYIVTAVPEKGRTRDGYVIHIAPPGGKMQKLTSVSRDSSTPWVKSYIGTMLHKDSKIETHPDLAAKGQ